MNNLIDVRVFITRLELLQLYMEYWLRTTPMSLPHEFNTYPDSVRDYFVESFSRLGWEITQDRIILRRKTFEEWLENHKTITY